MKILVVGYGYVGKAMVAAFDQTAELDYDIIDPAYPEYNNDLQEAYASCDAAVICVPTPPRANGRCDDSIVVDVIDKLNLVKTAPIIIKSTTDIDTLRHFQNNNHNVSFSPEFLRGRHAVEDFLKEEKMIIGGTHTQAAFWHTVFNEALMRDLEVAVVTPVEAGYAKYAENCFLAMRVTFFNELYRAFDRIEGEDGDYNNVVEALGLDPRIGHSHSQVPGPDGNFGWGGHCLPKDTLAWTSYVAKYGINADLMEFIRNLNFTKHATGDNKSSDSFYRNKI